MFSFGLVAVLAVTSSAMPAKDLVLAKGKSVSLPAEPGTTWAAEPAGVVDITQTDGKVVITALRDWFDETPNREPTATVRSCKSLETDAGVVESCSSFTVICLINTSGNWKLKLKGKWIGIFDHEEDREPVFNQAGRDISFEDRPPKDAQPPFKVVRIRLDGNRFRMTDGGGVLKSFNGTLKDRQSGEGEFSSAPGFSGKWKASRSP